MPEVALVPLSKVLRSLMWKAQDVRTWLEEWDHLREAGQLAVVIQHLGKMAEALETGLLDPVLSAWIAEKGSYLLMLRIPQDPSDLLKVAPPIPQAAEGAADDRDHADRSPSDLGEQGRTRKGTA